MIVAQEDWSAHARLATVTPTATTSTAGQESRLSPQKSTTLHPFPSEEAPRTPPSTKLALPSASSSISRSRDARRAGQRASSGMRARDRRASRLLEMDGQGFSRFDEGTNGHLNSHLCLRSPMSLIIFLGFRPCSRRSRSRRCHSLLVILPRILLLRSVPCPFNEHPRLPQESAGQRGERSGRLHQDARRRQRLGRRAIR